MKSTNNKDSGNDYDNDPYAYASSCKSEYLTYSRWLWTILLNKYAHGWTNECLCKLH